MNINFRFFLLYQKTFKTTLITCFYMIYYVILPLPICNCDGILCHTLPIYILCTNVPILNFCTFRIIKYYIKQYFPYITYQYSILSSFFHKVKLYNNIITHHLSITTTMLSPHRIWYLVNVTLLIYYILYKYILNVWSTSLVTYWCIYYVVICINRIIKALNEVKCIKLKISNQQFWN